MRNNQLALMMMFFSSLVLASCNQGDKSRSNSLASCQSRICSLVKVVGRDHLKYQDELQGIYKQISGLTNMNDRLVLYRSLANELLAFDFEEFSPSQRELMSDKYTPPFYGLALSMIKDGAAEQELDELIIGEFKKFRELCYPTNLCRYAENDHSIEARQQRAYVKGLMSRWENDAAVWERVYIPHVFGWYSEAATKRFLVRWHVEFGCHDRLHRGRSD